MEEEGQESESSTDSLKTESNNDTFDELQKRSEKSPGIKKTKTLVSKTSRRSSIGKTVRSKANSFMKAKRNSGGVDSAYSGTNCINIQTLDDVDLRVNTEE